MTKLYIYGAAALAAVVLLALVAGRIFNAGYESASDHYKAEIAQIYADYAAASAAEIARQHRANAAAKAREQQLIAELDAAEEETTSLMEKLRHEAAEDPGAGDIVLRAPSLRRLNQIR